ncbi:MAG: outer membrane lipoprotein-sorting protein [Spirochaetales bacterium]|nr:outer membrane lipoprotein-sorting protein [Spirochaetales bacterium]
MNNIRKTCLFTLIIFIVSGVYTVFSGETAFSIIKKAEEKNKSETSKTEISMLIYPDMDMKDDFRTYRVLAYSKGEDNSYMEFLSPRSIKGLRILSRGDDKWAYFASTGRVRKIAGKSRKESVQGVGGDFSYEDLGGNNFTEKYDFSIVKSDAGTWTLEGLPGEKDSIYSKILVIISKESYLMSKIEYYTEEDGHYKDLIMGEVRKMDGREVCTKMAMINHVKRSMTVVITHAVRYDIPVDDKYFNPSRFYK